jgi:alanine racemase
MNPSAEILPGRERALAEVDLGAIRHNVRRLSRDLPPGAVHCAVVKANGYGHGAVPVARAALEAGSAWLGVATASEAEELRDAGLEDPVIIFGPMTGAELERAVRARADVVVWSEPFARAAVSLGARCHLKFNSGMGRLGVAEDQVRELARLVASGPSPSSDDSPASGVSPLVGLMSHFATADEADTTFFEYQLGRFTALAGELKAAYPGLLCHTANSAATIRNPASHFDMVRTGIALYGLAPNNDDPFKDDLAPAMRLSSYVAAVRVVRPGESVGYGRRFVADAPARVAIVPIGYADGIARALTNRGDVLIAGRRCRITGTVSMDQLTVLLPDDHGRPGDEVVFFGESGGERILCEEVAQVLGTIDYEIVCDVSPRVVRRYRRAGPAA